MAAAEAKPARPARPKSALRGFVTMLWRQGLIALPMSVFFGTVAG